jgi:prepilin-type N-terminal cleavage/methylation domain-containing protein
MHRFNHRITAFSLIEMLVVLVLSSLVVTIIYFVYYTVSTYQMRLIKNQQATEDIGALFFLLKKDIVRSKAVQAVSTDDIECITHEGFSVLYSFTRSYVLRQQVVRIDTFHGDFTMPVFQWQGKSVERYPGDIDLVEINVDGMPLPARISIYKKYDVASLVNRAINDSLP